MTKEEYEKAIPPWCKLKTYEEHWEQMLLCWGITAYYAKDEVYCSGKDSDGKPCFFYNPNWKDGNRPNTVNVFVGRNENGT